MQGSTDIISKLREKCLFSELFWSAFSRIRTEYGEIFCISPYSVRMRENADQNNSEYGHFSRSGRFCLCSNFAHSKLDLYGGEKI